MESLPTLKPQELPLDHPDCTFMFQPGRKLPLVATPGAIQMYSREVILACLTILQAKAAEHRGIDYLQVFVAADKSEPLWFMEDGPGGGITALLPSEY